MFCLGSFEWGVGACLHLPHGGYDVIGHLFMALARSSIIFMVAK